MDRSGPSKGTEDSTKKEALDLKGEFQRLMKAIVEEDDHSADTTDQVLKTLYALKDSKSRPSLFLEVDEHGIPANFRCPMSGKLMRDPVVLSNGQTFDRRFIQKWLREGNRTCPQTEQVLSHSVLTPNHLVQKIISQWCKANGFEHPEPLQDPDEKVVAEADRDRFKSLLEKMSASLPDQKAAAKELRLLTKRTPATTTLFSESIDAIPQLIHPLSPGRVNLDPDLQEDLITLIFNASIRGSNKKLVGENPLVVLLLIESLKSGSAQTKANAAAALCTLADIDSNKHIIGKSGAMRPLLDLLEEGDTLTNWDVARAICNLCKVHENRTRAIREGAIRVILKKIQEGTLVSELVLVLAWVFKHQNAVEEMSKLGAVTCLLRLIRESTCKEDTENCVAMLYSCCKDQNMLREIGEDPDANATLNKVAVSGTDRANRKAFGILNMLHKLASASASSSHTA